MKTFEEIRNRLECIREEIQEYSINRDYDILFNLNEERELLEKRLQEMYERGITVYKPLKKKRGKK